MSASRAARAASSPSARTRGRPLPGTGYGTPWDPLHLAYFNGYAMWTYHALPFVLAEPGYGVIEIAAVEQDGQTLRGLGVRFPEGTHTHSREQRLYFGGDRPQAGLRSGRLGEHGRRSHGLGLRHRRRPSFPHEAEGSPARARRLGRSRRPHRDHRHVGLRSRLKSASCVQPKKGFRPDEARKRDLHRQNAHHRRPRRRLAQFGWSARDQTLDTGQARRRHQTGAGLRRRLVRVLRGRDGARCPRPERPFATR